MFCYISVDVYLRTIADHFAGITISMYKLGSVCLCMCDARVVEPPTASHTYTYI